MLQPQASQTRYYSPIAFEERVTLWFQSAQSQPCVCVCCIVFMFDCIMVIFESHMQIMQHTHMHKAVTGGVETKKVTLSSKVIRQQSGVFDSILL